MVNDTFKTLAHIAADYLLQRHYIDENGKRTKYLDNPSVTQALKNAIGYGGGFTLRSPIENYFNIEYHPGINIKAWRDDGDIVSVIEIPRKLVIEAAQEIWDRYHNKSMQLRLFE